MSAAAEPSANDLRVALQLLGAARRSADSLPLDDYKKVDALLVSASKRIAKVLRRLAPRRNETAQK